MPCGKTVGIGSVVGYDMHWLCLVVDETPEGLIAVCFSHETFNPDIKVLIPANADVVVHDAFAASRHYPPRWAQLESLYSRS
jgi:hypothetical protein